MFIGSTPVAFLDVKSGLFVPSAREGAVALHARVSDSGRDVVPIPVPSVQIGGIYKDGSIMPLHDVTRREWALMNGEIEE